MNPALPCQRTFGWVLAAVFALLFLLLYGGANIVSDWIPWRWHPALPGEAAWPFYPQWAPLYLLMPLLLLCCVLKLDWTAQWALLATLLAELLLACVSFVLLPVETTFPPRHVSGWAAPWFELATTLSMRHNHFPSLHVAFALTAALALQPVLRPLSRLLSWLWVMLVAASTVLIHEHHLLDIVAGAVLAVLAWRIVPPWAQQAAVLQRVRLEWLWCCNQWAFARRHRRYALISLMIATQRLRRPQRGTLLLSGYCFLQAVDDIMDGDRRSRTAPIAVADALLAAWQQRRFHTAHNLMLLAHDFQQRLAFLPDADHALADVGALLQVMRADRLRAEARAVWPASALAAQHQATFALSLDLLLAALGSPSRAAAAPALTTVLGWCSVMRDLREDIAAGIINIPQTQWQQLSPPPNGTPPDSWLRQPPLQQWMAAQHAQALQQLSLLDTQLAADSLDPRAQRIMRIFARSVRDFAQRRFYRLYPWLASDA